jgi:hypothetical protein
MPAASLSRVYVAATVPDDFWTLNQLVRAFPPARVARLQLVKESEVAPLSWTPDLLSFRSPQWQRSTHLMRRSSAGR